MSNKLVDIFGGKEQLAKAIRSVGSMTRLDTWVNGLTGLNTSRDKTSATTFSLKKASITQNSKLLDGIYHETDLGRKIVDIYADEQTRNWVTLSIQDENGADMAGDVMNKMRDLNARQVFTEALAWARLYGGAGVIMSVDDGKKMNEPLDVDSIKNVNFIHAVDRWQLSALTHYTTEDPETDEDFRRVGMPKIYTLNDGQTNKEIHESRIIRFEGVRTAKQRWRQNQQWSDSVFESVFQTLSKFDAGFDGAIGTMQNFSQGIYKIKGLANLLASDQDELVLKRLMMIDQTRSDQRAIAIDADDEEFTTQGAAVTGLADIIDRGMMRLSAATDIPVTRLFGRSAAGMNATGEGDEKNFEAKIETEQEVNLVPRVEYLISILMASSEGPTEGVMPESWNVRPNPLTTPSDKERAETRKVNAETDQIYLNAGVLVQTEVRQSRWGSDEYGTEIVLDETVDLEAREEEKQAKEEARMQRQLEMQQANEENKEDAHGYEIKNDGSLCSNCAFSAVGRCQRWDFDYDRGHGCDDFKEGEPQDLSVNTVERKSDAESLVKLRGRNF